MLLRFALIPCLLAISLPTCKKSTVVATNASNGATPAGSSSPAKSDTSAGSTTAAATPSLPPLSAPPPKVGIDQNAEVVIFGYHRFVNQVRRPDTEITPQDFEKQMAELKAKNIPVIPLQDMLAWKRGEKAIPPRAAVVTFDDGWKSQHDVAWPIMQKYGYPFTLFIYTEGIRPGHFSGGESMTWEMLAEMRDAGVDIQAHSATHQDLRRPYDKIAKKKLSPPEYEQWLNNELIGSKQMIEQKLGVKCNCFAVPYGFYNGHVKDVAIKAGYEAMFTVYGQPITYRTPNDTIGRYVIEANKPKVFEDAVAAVASVAAGPAVAEVANSSLTTAPANGETVRTPMPLIRANISSFGQIDPNSLQMRISGVGLVKPSYDPKTQMVSYQVTQKLNGPVTVIIGATVGGKKTEATFGFKVDASGAAAPPPAATPAAAPSASPAPTKK
jgi:peptidoglycan/xylan/chitin deacetylase (PgdA/CDA1 family)